jgi:succinate dehydrogenase/fumarate reductase-like Fe-S protein
MSLHAERACLARRDERRRLRRLRGAAPGPPDGARRRHAHPAPARARPELPLRLPRRHVRLVRDDGQRRGALDLPHARPRVAQDDRLEIAPLANLPVVKDLAVDMSWLLRQVGARQGPVRRARAHATTTSRASIRRRRSAAPPTPGSSASAARSATASCDVVEWRPDYLGPAALNRAWTLVNDERDTARRERLRAVAGDAGCHACHTQGSCVERCPKQIAPTAGIAGLKRLAGRAARRGERHAGPSRAAPSGGGPRLDLRAAAEARRWYWQRISAMVLALCVLGHLAVMVVRGAWRPDGARDPVAHAGQLGLRPVLRRLRRRLRRARADRLGAHRARVVRASPSPPPCGSRARLALGLLVTGLRAVFAVVWA